MICLLATAMAVGNDMVGSPDLDQCEHKGNPAAIAQDAARRMSFKHGLKPIQRTMKALEASTREKPAHIRVLFYGQSIVGQKWHPLVIDELKQRYPTAVFEVRNSAIGGFTSPDLVRTAESDLYPYYPDLLFFHVYGPMDKYEAIVRKVRETTTAEIVLWTSHLSRTECDKKEKIERAITEADVRSRAILDIANRYGCLFIDLRMKWARMMLDKGYGPDDLLRDGIHMDTKGPGFPAYAKFISEELLRDPGADGDPEPSGTITEISLDDPRVTRVADGSLSLAFEGNRVVVVSDGSGAGEVGVSLDGRDVASFAGMFYATRPSTFVSWMPMIKHVDFAPDILPVEEEWKLTYIEGTKPLGNPIHYRVDGSVTGFDGEGWNTNDFRSVSGRVLIAKSDFHTWQYGYFVKGKEEMKAKDSIPGQTITWAVKPLFKNPLPSVNKAGVHTVVIQNCPNASHVLTLKPKVGATCGLAGFVVYRPAVR